LQNSSFLTQHVFKNENAPGRVYQNLGFTVLVTNLEGRLERLSGDHPFRQRHP